MVLQEWEQMMKKPHYLLAYLFPLQILWGLCLLIFLFFNMIVDHFPTPQCGDSLDLLQMRSTPLHHVLSPRVGHC
jgi:hypothetical protein